jgi:hypothetical protein
MSRIISYEEQFNNISEIEKEAEIILARYYKKALGQINAELEKVQALLKKHQSEMDFTIANLEGEEKEKAMKFLRQQIFHRTDVQNRLLALRKKADEVIKRLIGETVINVIDTTDKTYQESYYRYAYVADKDIGINLDWFQLPESTIETSFKNSVAGLVNYTDNGVNMATNTGSWADKQYKLAKYAINETITLGTIQGLSVQEMAGTISEKIQQSYGRALRVSRTETMRVHNEAHNQTWLEMKDKGIDRVKFWRHRAFHVGDRDNHEYMNDKPADAQGFFSLPHKNTVIKTQCPGQTGYADEDIHCHCVFYTANKNNISPEILNKYPKFIEGESYDSWKSRLSYTA